MLERADLAKLRFRKVESWPPDEWAQNRRPLVYLPALPWDYRFQRPQQLAHALAAPGRPVLYVEAFARERLRPRLQVCTPRPGIWILRLRVSPPPLAYRRVLPEMSAVAVAETIEAGLVETPDAIFVQHPFWLHLALRLRDRLGSLLVYDRIDLLDRFPGVAGEIVDAETGLLTAADLVTCSADDLVERTRRAGARTVELVPNGVAIEDFALRTADTRKRPIVGYAGALASWFDSHAVSRLASERREWEVRLAGRVEEEEVKRLGALPNVRLMGEIPYDEVPAFLAALDLVLIPFRDCALTRSVNPVKLYEALACGLPVAARRLPELANWEEPLVYSYDREDELISQVEKALRENRPELARIRRQSVEDQTWADRARRLERHLSSARDLSARPGPEPEAHRLGSTDPTTVR